MGVCQRTAGQIEGAPASHGQSWNNLSNTIIKGILDYKQKDNINMHASILMEIKD